MERESIPPGASDELIVVGRLVVGRPKTEYRVVSFIVVEWSDNFELVVRRGKKPHLPLPSDPLPSMGPHPQRLPSSDHS